MRVDWAAGTDSARPVGTQRGPRQRGWQEGQGENGSAVAVQ